MSATFKNYIWFTNPRFISPNLFCDSPMMHPLVFQPTFSDLYAAVWVCCPHNKIITAYSSQVDRQLGPRPRKQRHYTCDVFLPILSCNLTLICSASSMYLCGAELTWLAKNKIYARIRCRTADTFPASQGKHFQLLMLHIPTHLQVFTIFSPAATKTTVVLWDQHPILGAIWKSINWWSNGNSMLCHFCLVLLPDNH